MNNRGLLGDRKNIELLRLLQKNPRASISDLARRVGMSNPAVKERVLRLEESGILAGYRLELKAKNLGYEVMAFVRVRPLPGRLPKSAGVARAICTITES